MTGRMGWVRAAAILAAGTLAACGGEAPAPGGEALQPLAPGDTWTYETSEADGSDASRKTVTVTAVETVDGVEAALVESVRTDRVSRVWLAEIEGRIVRLREENERGGVLVDIRRFEPGSLRTPAAVEGLRVGDTVVSSYAEITLATDDGRELARRDRAPTWTVEATDDPVETPAGRFRAVRLLKTGDDGDGEGLQEKRVWYAPGVGKVREDGGRIEVLVSYRRGG